MRPALRALSLALRAAALVGAVAVLMADSTNDCGVYRGWNGEYRFLTTCGPGAEGTVAFSLPELDREPGADQLQVDVREGAASFTPTRLEYSGNCSGGDGEGSLKTVVLDLSPDPSNSHAVYQCSIALGPLPVVSTCSERRDAGAGEAGAADAGAQSCELTLQSASTR